MVMLLWLTVSLPFVFYASQQSEQLKVGSANTASAEEEEAGNPVGNTTEEKAPSSAGINLSEEYLDHNNDLFHSAEIFLGHHTRHAFAEYVAYHGEMLSPPPNC